VVDLELRDLLVLVGRDGDERRLVERVGVERVPTHAEDVVRLHDVDPRLILVHRVHYDLYKTIQLNVIYTVSPKKLCQLIFCSLSVKYEPISIKIGRIVPDETLNEIYLNCPLHLKYVLALPCEI